MIINRMSAAQLIWILVILIGLNMTLPVVAFSQNETKGGRINHRDHFYQLAKEALDNEDYEQAVVHLDRSLGYDAHHAESYYLRAIAREQLGNDEGALTDYSIVVHIKPEYVEGRFGRAILLFNLQRYEASKEDFLELLVTPLTETNALYFRASNYTEGVSGVMTMETNRSEVYNYLGLVCGKLEQYDEGLAYFRKAIGLNGTDPNFYINRGLLHESHEQLDSARLDYEKALQLDDGNDLATYNLLRLSDNHQAIDLYGRLIEEDPDFDEPYAQRGLARYNIGDYRGALLDYNRALEINPGDHENLLNRGLIKEKLRDVRGALRDYDQAIRIDPGFARAFLNRGNLLTKQRFYSRAITDYDRAIELDPLNAMTFYNRGVARYNMRDKQAACQDVMRALDLGMTGAAETAAKMCPQDQ